MRLLYIYLTDVNFIYFLIIDTTNDANVIVNINTKNIIDSNS